ncbi:hypothetical protein T265_13881, partial [Opisthorchis viverrini]
MEKTATVDKEHSDITPGTQADPIRREYSTIQNESGEMPLTGSVAAAEDHNDVCLVNRRTEGFSSATLPEPPHYALYSPVLEDDQDFLDLMMKLGEPGHKGKPLPDEDSPGNSISEHHITVSIDRSHAEKTSALIPLVAIDDCSIVKAASKIPHTDLTDYTVQDGKPQCYLPCERSLGESGSTKMNGFHEIPSSHPDHTVFTPTAAAVMKPQSTKLEDGGSTAESFGSQST